MTTSLPSGGRGASGFLRARKHRLLFLNTEWTRAQLRLHTRDTAPVELSINGQMLPPVDLRDLPSLLTVLGLPMLERWEEGTLARPTMSLTLTLATFQFWGATRVRATGSHPVVELVLAPEDLEDPTFRVDLSANGATLVGLSVEQATPILSMLGLGPSTTWEHLPR